MARATRPPRDSQPKKTPTLIGTILVSPFTISLRLIRYLFMAIIISIIVEWVVMVWFWPDDPQHAEKMLVDEIAYLGNNFKTSVTAIPPSEIVKQNVQAGYNALFQSKLIQGIHRWQKSQSRTAIEQHIKKFLLSISGFISAAAYIALVTIARMTIFILSSPWFVLCGVIGFVDGFVERAIRTDEGGLEHGFLHHTARRHAGIAFFTASVLYLSMPWTINPSWILIPAGILFGMNIYVIAWSFKKFL